MYTATTFVNFCLVIYGLRRPGCLGVCNIYGNYAPASFINENIGIIQRADQPSVRILEYHVTPKCEVLGFREWGVIAYP